MKYDPNVPVWKVCADDNGSAKAPVFGVYLDTKREALVATNGCAQAAVSVEVDEVDVSGLVPVEALEAGRGELSVGERVIVARKGTAEETTFVRTGAHRVPFWWKLCPEDASEIRDRLTIAIDPELLFRLATSLSSPSYLELTFSAKPGANWVADSIHAIGEDGPSFGVIMPIGPRREEGPAPTSVGPCDIAVAAAKKGIAQRRGPKPAGGNHDR